ncbi:MAG: penicillin-binding protein 2 [Anaerolineae bacterium]|nr:penicillin-binding protein 2 [Anaerolineae bacterium]
MTRSQLGRIGIRISAYRLAAALLCLALVGQLWRLQMIQGDYYQQAADYNRFRLESSPGPRGVIYDRWGHLLVRNTPRIAVSIIPAYLPDDPGERHILLVKLARLLDIPFTSQSVKAGSGARPVSKGLVDILREAELAPYRPVLLKIDLPRDTALLLEEQHLDWPGVLVQAVPQREYLYGPLLAHYLGYVGPIPAEQVEDYQARGYDPNQHQVGLTGVEYSFEEDLRGRDGSKLIEVDIAGREVQTLGQVQPQVPGNNLRLTLDLGLQQAATDILSRHIKAIGKKQGVVVAMNPQTGEVLAMVSLPTYDDNKFAGGISPEELAALQTDPNRPLLNHAISGQFAPGSTFKIVTASAGLAEGVIDANTRLSCRGTFWLPNRFYPEDPSLAQPFYCWTHKYGASHGSLNIISALAVSCDIFFYQVGGGYLTHFQGLGEQVLGYYAELFGLGNLTGIDLPAETAGLVPTAKWKRINYSESWVTGDTYNMAIGQGFVLATPLQMLNATSAIANGGTLYRPQVVRDIVDSQGHVVRAFAPDLIRQLPVQADQIEIVRQGMRAAVVSGGTATAAALPTVAVAGKTGTAEFFIDRNNDRLPDRDREGNLPTHAWFVGFAPYDHPQIAIVVFVFGGGEGSTVAAPIAGDILGYYFGLK